MLFKINNKNKHKKISLKIKKDNQDMRVKEKWKLKSIKSNKIKLLII